MEIIEPTTRVDTTAIDLWRRMILLMIIFIAWHLAYVIESVWDPDAGGVAPILIEFFFWVSDLNDESSRLLFIVYVD